MPPVLPQFLLNKADQTSRAIEVLGFGCVSVDDFCHVASYPPADAKARVLRKERRFGGLIGNALVAAARLGARSAFVGTLGNDELSDFAIAAMEKEHIDVSRIRRTNKAGPVHSNLIVGNDRGTRNIFFDISLLVTPSSAGLKEAINVSRAVLIDHYAAKEKLEATLTARARHIPVVADFESAEEPGFPDLLEAVDHLILSHEFASRLGFGSTPAGILKALWNSGRKTAAVTCGAKGVWYLTEATPSKPRHLPAFAVKTVDTTGCGDVFHGAYAAGISRGLSIEECLRLASASAALKASRPPGADSIPRRKEVERFLTTF